MKIKNLIAGLALSLTMGAGVFAGAAASSNETKPVEALGSYSCTKLTIKDTVGWSYRTFWLDSFSYSTGYSKQEFEDFLNDYYGNEITSWDSEGTVRGWHNYGDGFNLCAGGSSGPYEFVLPYWVEDCTIQIENNGVDKRFVNKLSNVYEWSNNTGSSIGNCRGKTVTFDMANWGATASADPNATASDFGISFTKIGLNTAKTEIGRNTATVSKYELLSYSISGKTFEGWFTDSSLSSAYSSKLPLSNSTLYAKFDTAPANGYHLCGDSAFVTLIGGTGAAWSWDGSVRMNDTTGGNKASYVLSPTANIVFRARWAYNGDTGWVDFGDVSGTGITKDGDNVILAAGTYAIYISNTDSKAYISVGLPLDSYVTEFLSSTGSICNGDSTNKAALLSAMSSLETDYGKMSVSDRNTLAGTSPSQSGTDAQKVIARYDYILGKYGYGTGANEFHDFMGRTPARLSANIRPISVIGDSNNGNAIAIVVITSIIALTTIGGYFFFRKRKEN